MSRILRGAIVVAAALLLASCGGNGNGSGGDAGGENNGGGGDGGAATLATTDNAFQPASLTVSAGAELEVTNKGQTTHNFSIEGSDVSQDVDAGQSTTVIVDVDPGEYTMFCEYHRAFGMEGPITVQ